MQSFMITNSLSPNFVSLSSNLYLSQINNICSLLLPSHHLLFSSSCYITKMSTKSRKSRRYQNLGQSRQEYRLRDLEPRFSQCTRSEISPRLTNQLMHLPATTSHLINKPTTWDAFTSTLLFHFLPPLL